MLKVRPAPEISVVIPTYNRPELLEVCLKALTAQDYDPDCFEVIVADDGCSPVTARLVESFAIRPGPAFHYIGVEGPKHGPAVARNRGWRQARGEIIAFTDDDCRPAPGWLAAGAKALTGDIAGVSGRVVVPLPPDPTDHQLNYTGLTHSLFVTANCFYRRSALEAVGGFDEQFQMAWREDSDLFFSLLKLGVKLGCAPEALVTHPVPPARWGSSLQQQRKAIYNALLYKKHPAFYRQYLAPVRPWHYYPILAAALVAAGGLGLGRWRLAGIAGSLWLLLTGRFCLARLKHTSHSFSHIAEMAVTSAVLPPLSIFWRLRGALKFRVFFF